MKATKYSQYLQNREHLQYVDTPHWIYIFEGVILTGIILGVGFLIESFLASRFITPRLAENPLLDDWFINIMGYLAFAVKWGTLIIAAAFFINRIVFYLSTYVFASERRLYIKTGLLLTRVDDINFDEIKSIEVNYGFFGRLLGYGKLNMDARFVKDTDIPFVYNPENFMKLINFESDLVKDVNLSFATQGMSDGEAVERIGDMEQKLSKRQRQTKIVQKYERLAEVKRKHREDPADIIEEDFDHAVLDDDEGDIQSKDGTKRKPVQVIDFDN